MQSSKSEHPAVRPITMSQTNFNPHATIGCKQEQHDGNVPVGGAALGTADAGGVVALLLLVHPALDAHVVDPLGRSTPPALIPSVLRIRILLLTPYSLAK